MDCPGLVSEQIVLELLDVDVTALRGLEFGPLDSPVVGKDQGTVFYLDHVSVDGLRQKYTADSLRGRLHEIVNLDYVVGPGQSVSEVVQHDAPFDYVIAKHLIEHIPDIVTWLAEVAKVLRPGGLLCLVVPDKRVTFDINRSPTEICDVVDVYLRKLTRPSYRQMYDFFSKAIDRQVDTAAAWAGTADYRGTVRSDFSNPDAAALSACQTVLDSDELVDAHCHVFTPDSFLTILDKLVNLDLLDFEVRDILPTPPGLLEFYVILRCLDGSQPNDQNRERQVASLARARQVVEAAPKPAEPTMSETADSRLSTSPDDRGSSMVVSHLERRLILVKRQGITATRRLLRSVKHARP